MPRKCANTLLRPWSKGITADPLIIHGVTVRVEFRAQSRGLRLRIDRVRKCPVVSAPARYSLSKIKAFVENHWDWVLRELGALVAPDVPETLVIHGVPHSLETDFTGHRARLVWDEAGCQISYTGPQERLGATLIKHITHRARDVAWSYSQGFADQLGVTIQSVKMGEYKSRWGACSRAGDLSYSWRLVLAPPEIFAYVCAHEVAHRVHPNHSRAFWETVRSLDPQCMTHRRWLKDHGVRLYGVF